MSEREDPEYLVTETSFIGNGVVQEGGKVVYHGLPGSKLEPLNAAAKSMKKKAEDQRTKEGQVVRRTVQEDLAIARHVPAPKPVPGDEDGQGAILDDGSDFDPAEPFDPANASADNPVHLPKPAEDTVTPGRAKELTAAQKKAKAAQAAAKAKPEPKAEADEEDLT